MNLKEIDSLIPKGSMIIRLTRDKFAIVDECDYERVSAYNWYATVNSRHEVRYAARTFTQNKKRVCVGMHNFILGGLFIDHKNGNGFDNRRCNLRFATRRQNQANQRKKLGCASQFKGVTAEKSGSWRATIRAEGRRIYLSVYNSEVDAAAAYDRAAKVYFGEFAWLNNPSLGTITIK